MLHRGKIARAPKIISVRPLTVEDLGCLRKARAVPRVQAFRDTHHRLARLCAVGLRNEEILRITGYSAQRLSTLRQDPAFQDLITSYRDKVASGPVDEFAETAISNQLRMERMVEAHLDAADESDELLPLKLLLPAISDRADRFGYPKKKEISANVTHDFARRIEQNMARLGRATVIDATATRTALAPTPERVVSLNPSPSSQENQSVVVGVRRRF